MKCRKTHQKKNEVPRCLQTCGTPMAPISACVMWWLLHTIPKQLCATAYVPWALGTPHELGAFALCHLT